MKILIIGRSGSGKSTLANYLTEKYGLKQLESYATRPMRVKNEKGHRFITPEEAKNFTDRVAETVINGYEYFATRQQVDECDVYVIDPKGLVELCKRMPDTKFYVVYLRTLNDSRMRAAINRADDPEKEEEIFKKRNASEDDQFFEFERFLDSNTIDTNSVFADLPDDIKVNIFFNRFRSIDELYKIGDTVARMYAMDKNHGSDSTPGIPTLIHADMKIRHVIEQLESIGLLVEPTDDESSLPNLLFSALTDIQDMLFSVTGNVHDEFIISKYDEYEDIPIDELDEHMDEIISLLSGDRS